MRRVGEERGGAPLVLAAGVTGVVLAIVLVAQVTQLAVARGVAQVGADAAALAGAQQLLADVRGTDAASFDCAVARPRRVDAEVHRFARANGATVTRTRVDGCDVEAHVAVRRAGMVITVRAAARARVVPGARPGGGPRRAVAVPGAPLARGSALEALVAEADRIDRLRLPYVWGGGHQSSPAPPDGPFDCSGAVSRVLQAAGYPIPTLVSRQFMQVGRPGPGRVTIWAYDGHVFMTIDGRGWGTGSPPRGGAGWLPYATPYHGRFVARHLPEFEDDATLDLSDLDLGTVVVGSGAGTPPSVALVP
jgi:cell wall-associated NlpC family hydrolase